jgi:polyisoprenyl-phosphate glycosyltransferase
MNNIPAISIVVPLLNEEKNINLLYNALGKVLGGIGMGYEIIFVDDGSTDSSFMEIERLNQLDPKVRGLSFSKNFGHQIALMAGLDHARGDIIVMMDADLQHPPEVIIQLLEKYREGFDIVNTRRIDNEKLGWFKKMTSRFFYWFINVLSDTKIEPASSDFRLMDRKAANAFLNIREQDRFTRGLVSWMGFRQAIVPYEAPLRKHGTSKYTIRKMMRFALDGITSFSSKPLRISLYFGFVVFLLGLAYSVFALVNYFRGHTLPGWTSQLVSILILGGVQLVSIGILGEYIARIFKESKNRPMYIIGNSVGNIEKQPDNRVYTKNEN